MNWRSQWSERTIQKDQGRFISKTNKQNINGCLKTFKTKVFVLGTFLPLR